MYNDDLLPTVACEKCAVLIHDDDAHFAHDEDCPNFRHFDDDEWVHVPCDCHNIYCEACCPECGGTRDG